MGVDNTNTNNGQWAFVIKEKLKLLKNDCYTKTIFLE